VEALPPNSEVLTHLEPFDDHVALHPDEPDGWR